MTMADQQSQLFKYAFILDMGRWIYSTSDSMVSNTIRSPHLQHVLLATTLSSSCSVCCCPILDVFLQLQGQRLCSLDDGQWWRHVMAMQVGCVKCDN
jgi:hypothetical protein